MSSSRNAVRLIALTVGLHFVLSSVAMNLIMGLRLHNLIDPNGPLLDATALGLEWIFFFPNLVFFNWFGFNPSSDIALLSVNTLCWCLIVLPAVAVIRYIFQKVKAVGIE